MPDADVIEANAKKHPEDPSRGAAVAEDTPKPKVKNPKTGQAVLFEGYAVEIVETRIVGDLVVEADYLPKGTLCRFEGIAKVNAVTHKTIKRTEHRIQQVEVMEVELLPPGITEDARAQIARKLAESHQAQEEAREELEVEGGQG